MPNDEIRTCAREHGVLLWQLADGLGIADTTLCRKMRKELSNEEKSRALEVIEQISKGANEE